MRNVLAHAGKGHRRLMSAWIGTGFAKADMLTFMSFPEEYRAKIHSISPLERVNGEVKRHTDVVGIFPNEAAINHLVSAVLPEAGDE